MNNIFQILFFQVDRLLELKLFCQELGRANSKFQIADETWFRISEFHVPLKMVSQKMTAFQRADLTLSDVYGDWMELQANLRDVEDSAFVTKLLAALDDRGAPVMRNHMMLTSVFLDPRFNLMLSSEEICIAKKILTDLSESNRAVRPTNENVIAQTVAGNVDDTQLSAFERYLRSFETRENAPPRADLPLLIEMDNFQQLGRQPLTKSIHIFWSEYQRKYPLLFKLSNIIMAIPPTEVSCERNFSKLKFVMNRLRCSLVDSELEKMLYLNLNSNLFDLI